LKRIPERSELVTVELRDIGKKLFDGNFKAQDQYMNTVTLKDVVKIILGQPDNLGMRQTNYVGGC
jgi:small nuclear ribonucleoprotein (snRNP)-like protein